MTDRAELLSAAFELVPDGVLIFDDTGRWIEANREAYRLLAEAGRPLDELIGGLEGFLLDGSASGSFETARGRVQYTATASIAGGANMLVLRQAERDWVESRLVTTINREVRMPLNGVVGASRLLEGTNLDARQREYVQALGLSADALVGVIDGIIDFSGLEGAGIGRAPEPFDLRTVVEEVCAVGALGTAGAELELFSYVDPQLPGVVHGDERRVRQVLMTLVGNAVKFTPSGEVVVEAGLGEGGDGGAMIRFRVLDTGIGVEARGRESLFEGPAGDEEPAGPAGEVGLGLAIARRLVAIMGGELGVERTPDGRTAFWFHSPLSVDPRDPGQAPPSGLEGVRVLVVDARPARALLLARQLESWGTVGATEGSRDAALATLRSAVDAGSPYDLVIGGRDFADGPELARAIGADPVLAGLRTVLIAAAGEEAPAGVDAVITGPVGRRRMHADLMGVLAAEPADRSAAASPSPATGGRVLVAEDNVVNQLVAVHLLEERGFEVDVAHDGIEALALHAENSYEAIFMDIEMPRLDGYEATREIRRREGEDRHTPIIAMTASTLPDGRERALAAGMDYHTGNPIRPAGLDYIIALAVRGVRVPA